MMDDKKIEEAAVKSTNYLKGICDFTVINASKEGFRAGANLAIHEFLKNLWHPAREEPQKRSVFLYQTANNTFGMSMIVEARDWKFVTKYQRATRWFYIDDLFPKKGGEQ